MNKKDLIIELNEAHNALWNAAKARPSEVMNQRFNNKWSVNENVEHINKSILAFGQFMKAPKEILKEKFGVSKSISRPKEEVISIYKATITGAQSTPKYVPEEGKHFDLNELVETGKHALNDLNASVNDWTEEELDLYLCPHPLLGKLTAREMCYFTAFHALHHKASVECIQQVGF